MCNNGPAISDGDNDSDASDEMLLASCMEHEPTQPQTDAEKCDTDIVVCPSSSIAANQMINPDCSPDKFVDPDYRNPDEIAVDSDDKGDKDALKLDENELDENGNVIVHGGDSFQSINSDYITTDEVCNHESHDFVTQEIVIDEIVTSDFSNQIVSADDIDFTGEAMCEITENDVLPILILTMILTMIIFAMRQMNKPLEFWM